MTERKPPVCYDFLLASLHTARESLPQSASPRNFLATHIPTCLADSLQQSPPELHDSSSVSLDWVSFLQLTLSACRVLSHKLSLSLGAKNGQFPSSRNLSPCERWKCYTKTKHLMNTQLQTETNVPKERKWLQEDM